MSGRKFENGETVMGRWPGSSLYYEVLVVTYDVPTQLYTVRYKDGTELEIKESDIKNVNSFRAKKGSSGSPSRRRSRSRSQSPSRSRSPGRSRKSAPKETSQNQELKRGSVLQVHLTPLKLNEYNIAKRNGEPEGFKKAIEQVKVDHVTEKHEKVLRYSLTPRKEVMRKENVKEETVKEQIPAEIKESTFGGNLGAAVLMLFLPSLLFYLLITCREGNASSFDLYWNFTVDDFVNYSVLGLFLLWIFLQCLLYLLPVGKIADGVPLANGKRLKYRVNGLSALFFTAVAVGGALYYKINFLFVYDHFLQFAASAALFSIMLSIGIFGVSYKARNEELSLAGSSGNFIYKFCMGRELNPRIGQFDVKYFCIQTGLITWVFINLMMMLAEMQLQNRDLPSVSMILVNGFQLLYAIDALNTDRFLTSPEIVSEGFGFVFAFGNLALVPFSFSLQSFYLASHSVDISLPVASAIIALNVVGYVIYFGSNHEKYSFRKNPDNPRLAHLKTMPTSAGKKLLISGWWGFIRHPNYLGDIIIAWAWCLPCGFTHIVPYYYGIFLTISLLYREAKNEKLCRQKYGLDWEKYCQRVPYRILPYIY